MVIVFTLDSSYFLIHFSAAGTPVSFLIVVFNIFQKQFKSKKVQMSLL